MTNPDLRVLELMSARLCHELAGPLAAVMNGVELIGEDDPDFAADALRLLGTSARSASRRLQFYRFAYGPLPGEGAAPALGRELALKLFEQGNVVCDWPDSEVARPLAWQRLICLFLVLAAEALPRGGTVAVRQRGAGLAIEGDGDTVRLLPETQAGMQADIAPDKLTARGIHAYLCMQVAASLGLRLANLRVEPRRLRIELNP
jgi:histidine phosphotransferase ChpT